MGSGMEWVFNNLNGIYRYKSLYFFKRKFNPRWEPRYLAYPGAAALPQRALRAGPRPPARRHWSPCQPGCGGPAGDDKAAVALRPAREGAEG